MLVLPKPARPGCEVPTAYRPISLLPTLGKMLEKLSALEQITGVIRKYFKKNCYTLCILLDINGALGHAWHPRIITALVIQSAFSF